MEKNEKMKKCIGFTLAEVLITLAIIGVVAALTIPTVVSNYKERQLITQYKKVYSELNQAFQMAQIKEGPVSTWNLGSGADGDGTTKLLDKMKPYLKISKFCGIDENKKCFSDNLKTMNGKTAACTDVNSNITYERAVLSDGTAIWFYRTNSNPELYAVGVDLNGIKPPNKWGIDTFYFGVHHDTGHVFPHGKINHEDLTTRCNKDSSALQNGYSCGYWILTHENMDYTKKTMKCGSNPPDDCYLE